MAEAFATLAEPDLDKARTMQSAVPDKRSPEVPFLSFSPHSLIDVVIRSTNLSVLH